MAASELLAGSFRSDFRSKGEDDYRKGAVFISQAADTEVRASVKSAGAGRVTLNAEAVDSTGFSASCTCPNGKKGLLCRHIWATILKLEEKESDFILNKDRIGDFNLGPAAPKTPSATEVRQREFKQQQSERLKLRNKEIRQRKKDQNRTERGHGVQYPEPVQLALRYFEDNGFPLSANLDAEALESARRQLARVFHPDKGGTHEEILELNEQFEVLSSYL